LASQAHEQHAAFQYLCGDTDGAIATFRAAAELDPRNARARVKLAAVLADLDRKDDALAEFDAALTLA
ncbi:unnamed protein product, partial [Phaeothamnion confervicola]